MAESGWPAEVSGVMTTDGASSSTTSVTTVGIASASYGLYSLRLSTVRATTPPLKVIAHGLAMEPRPVTDVILPGRIARRAAFTVAASASKFRRVVVWPFADDREGAAARVRAEARGGAGRRLLHARARVVALDRAVLDRDELRPFRDGVG